MTEIPGAIVHQRPDQRGQLAHRHSRTQLDALASLASRAADLQLRCPSAVRLATCSDRRLEAAASDTAGPSRGPVVPSYGDLK